jgi:hypothetical protein
VFVEKQLNICLNPNCKKEYENLIVISDYSKNPPDRYYGCPFCFFRLAPITIQKLTTNDVFFEKRCEPQKTSSEDNVQESCPHYFGYLSNQYKNTIISKECLLCSRMSGCMLKGLQETK